MAMFVVKSIVIQSNGQSYGSINRLDLAYINISQ